MWFDMVSGHVKWFFINLYESVLILEQKTEILYVRAQYVCVQQPQQSDFSS